MKKLLVIALFLIAALLPAQDYFWVEYDLDGPTWVEDVFLSSFFITLEPYRDLYEWAETREESTMMMTVSGMTTTNRRGDPSGYALGIGLISKNYGRLFSTVMVSSETPDDIAVLGRWCAEFLLEMHYGD